jgi:hypothetical protein
MRRRLQILTVLALLVAPCGMAQALDAAKVDSINKATDAFIALAKDPSKAGKPPRLNDPAAKPLLNTVFNTKEIEGGKPLPFDQINLLYDWHQAAFKAGLVYYLAGTGTDDPIVVAKDPKLTLRANQNTATFAPEFGAYYDAKIRIFAAMVDSAAAQLAAATPEQMKDPEFQKTVNGVSDGMTRAILGVLGTFVLDGMPEDWLLLRTALLLEVTPKTAKFISPDDRKRVQNAAFEISDQIKNPDVKSGVNTIARGMLML